MVNIFHKGVSQYYGQDKQRKIQKCGAKVEEIVFVFPRSQDALISPNITNNYFVNK